VHQVKARRGTNYGSPLESSTYRTLTKLRQLAGRWLQWRAFREPRRQSGMDPGLQPERTPSTDWRAATQACEDCRGRHWGWKRYFMDQRRPRPAAEQPTGGLTRDNIVDNITLYWLTGTGASAAWWHWEFGRAQAAARAAGQAPPAVSVPVGFTTFPGEIWAAPRNWVETVYPNLTYFNEVDSGGHFAAWEEPDLFATDVRAAFRPLQKS